MSDGKQSRQVLHKQARGIVFRVYQYFKSLSSAESAPPHGAGRAVAKCQEQTAEACGIGLRTVQRISSEANASLQACGSAIFKSPGKHHKRKKEVGELDDFSKNVLRRTVFGMYARGEYPTAEKLVSHMKEAENFNGSKWTMLRILKDMGFRYQKTNDGRKLLLERSDIVAARTVFLRTMQQIRQAGTSRIYYLDETFVNQNHARAMCWKMSDGHGGLKVPVGKGGRIIVLHVGSAETGFIPQSKLIFKASKAKNSEDYHSEMTYVIFRRWFKEQLLPYIPPCSVIVMDNASIHSVQVNKAPTTNSKKADIIAWLTSNGIPHSSSHTRAELLVLVNAHKPAYKVYEIDEIAKEHGHRVVRLPPYHCHYNPIELVWAQVKAYIADKNKTFKIADVERLTHEAIESISKSAWAACVRHAEKLQEEDYEREIGRDTVMEPFVINLAECESSTSDSEEDNGIDFLP